MIRSQKEKQEKRWSRLEQLVTTEFRTSYMSNSKWVKLLKCLCQFANTCTLHFKLVYSEEVKTSYVDEFEEHIDAHWFREPTIYKELEWLEVTSASNDVLENIFMRLNKAGKFNLVRTESGLRAIGYGRV